MLAELAVIHGLMPFLSLAVPLFSVQSFMEYRTQEGLIRDCLLRGQFSCAFNVRFRKSDGDQFVNSLSGQEQK